MSSVPLSSKEERQVQRVLRVMRFLRDPAFPGLLLMIGLVLAGFGAVMIGWYGSARTIYVPLQIPEVISGAVGGVALIGLGAALFDLQVARRQAAREKAVMDQMLDEIADIVSLGPKLRERADRKRADRRDS